MDDIKLYVKEIESGDIKKPKVALDFLRLYFNPLTLNRFATYTDKTCVTLQCGANRMRSFDDVYLLLKTYYPKMTIKGTMHRILVLKFTKVDPNNSDIVYHYAPSFYCCSTMQRIRITIVVKAKTKPNYTWDYDYIINNVQKYNSKHSWKELFDMVGIKNQQDLTDYLEKTE